MINLEPLPMESAIQFWLDKYLLSPGEYAQLSDEAKIRAFAVSGIAKGEELETVFNALQRALEKGTTFEDFKRDARAVFERRGWTGKAAWRLETIFRTNVQTAYSVGRYKEMMAVAKDRPYWQYSAVNDSRTRPTHWEMNGKIFPYGHPFWNTWYPPNGFNCRCGVVTLSQDDIDSENLPVETEDPTGGLVEPIDPVTGNKLPARSLVPDQGFDHNPGKSIWGGIVPKESKSGFTDKGINTYTDYGQRKMENLRKKDYFRYGNEDIVPRGLAEMDYYKKFISEFSPETVKQGIYHDKAGETLVISLDLFTDIRGKLKIKKKGREQYVKLLARTIQNPYEIWLVPMMENKSGRIVLRRRYIRGFSTGPDNKMTGFTAFEYGSDGWTGVTAFQPDDFEYANKLRNGVLIFKDT